MTLEIHPPSPPSPNVHVFSYSNQYQREYTLFERQFLEISSFSHGAHENIPQLMFSFLSWGFCWQRVDMKGDLTWM